MNGATGDHAGQVQASLLWTLEPGDVDAAWHDAMEPRLDEPETMRS